MAEFFGAVWAVIREFAEAHTDTLSVFIVCFCLGAVVASVIAAVQKRGVGRLVRCLLANDATDSAHACSLRDMGLANSLLLHFSLRCGSLLYRTVSPVGTDDKKRMRCDIPLYIEPDNKERAEHLYTGRGSGVGSVLLTVLIAAVLCVVLLLTVPMLIDLVKTTFSQFGQH